jgi:hypothetical protein
VAVLVCVADHHQAGTEEVEVECLREVLWGEEVHRHLVMVRTNSIKEVGEAEINRQLLTVTCLEACLQLACVVTHPVLARLWNWTSEMVFLPQQNSMDLQSKRRRFNSNVQS